MKPSLRASILRRTKGKEPKFRQRQNVKFYRFKKRFVVFVLVLGVGYLVYWIQMTTPFSNDSESTALVEDFDPGLVLDHTDELSTKDLIYLASRMDFDSTASLPVQMEWIKDRIDISSQLLSKPDDELAQKEGTLYRLETLQLLSNLNRKYSLGNTTVDAQLFELCSANLSHSDREVSKIAAVVVMMTSLHQFSNEPSLANLKDALEKCSQISSQLNDDDEIALAIFKYARLMKRSDLTVDDSVEFFKVVIDQFLDSRNSNAVEIAKNSYREILFGDQSGESRFATRLVAGIRDRFRQNRKSIDSEITNRILYSLQPQLIDVDAVGQLLELLEVLISREKTEEAEELLVDVREFFAGKSSQDLIDDETRKIATQRLNEFERRLNHLGREFDLENLTFFDNQSLKTDQGPVLLIYWSPNEAKSMKLLNSLSNLSISNAIQCIIICLDTSNEESKLIEKLAKEIPDFKFAIVDPDSTEQDAEFISRFPVPKFPYLVVLDNLKRVASINPELKDLGNRIQAVAN